MRAPAFSTIDSPARNVLGLFRVYYIEAGEDYRGRRKAMNQAVSLLIGAIVIIALIYVVFTLL